MCNSSQQDPTPRVVRKHAVRELTKSNYRRRARLPLEDDFRGRCAYCMRHMRRIGKTSMEIDHFDPRKRNAYQQDYDNLFLSSRGCNNAKSNTWPSPEEEKKGIRFLNCCKENEYDGHIVEDPNTHLLCGLTREGRYHIRMIDLNRDELVAERRNRARLRELRDERPVLLRHGNSADLAAWIPMLDYMIDEMIPDIG